MAHRLNSQTLNQKLLKRNHSEGRTYQYADAKGGMVTYTYEKDETAKYVQLYNELGLVKRSPTIKFSSFEKIFGKAKLASDTHLGILIAAIRAQPDWGWEATFEEFIDYGKDENRLPDNEGFFTSLQHNRFLMPVVKYEEDGESVIKWWNERSLFVSVDPPEHCPTGTLAFKGIQINNVTKEPFLLVAHRVGDFLFTVTGFHPQQQFSYHASFTKCFTVNKQEVLSGTWVGMDHTCQSSHFRCFLSSSPISFEAIESVTAEHSFDFNDGQTEVKWDGEEVVEFPKPLVDALYKEEDSPGTLLKVWKQTIPKKSED